MRPLLVVNTLEQISHRKLFVFSKQLKTFSSHFLAKCFSRCNNFEKLFSHVGQWNSFSLLILTTFSFALLSLSLLLLFNLCSSHDLIDGRPILLTLYFSCLFSLFTLVTVVSSDVVVVLLLPPSLFRLLPLSLLPL